MLNIIHVDDSKFALRTTKKIIKNVFEDSMVIALTDYEFMEFTKKEEFLEKIDIAIVDLIMPCASGHDVIKILRKNSEKTLIVVLSSNVQQTEKELALKNGAEVFLEKPVTLDKIKIIREKLYDKSGQ
jgi:CheY-like chemotaxis protein